MPKCKILFLGPESPLVSWLREQGEEVVRTNTPVSQDVVKTGNFNFLISYGYRYLIGKDVLDLFPGRAMNLHISYLPWNRGADPNLWSFVDATPKGVTIHLLDEGLDSGDIIAQSLVEVDQDRDTLASSYMKLQEAIQDLFKQCWPVIKQGNARVRKQEGDGTFHKAGDKERIAHLLTHGWQTPVSVFKNDHKKSEPD